jgi:hypothetical protein
MMQKAEQKLARPAASAFSTCAQRFFANPTAQKVCQITAFGGLVQARKTSQESSQEFQKTARIKELRDEEKTLLHMIGYDHNAEIKRYEDEILRKRIAVNKLEDKVDAIKRDLDRSWFKGSKKESLRRWQDVLKNEQESLNAEIVTYSDLVKNKPSLQEELQSSQLFKKRFSDVLQELDKLEGKDKPEIIKVVPYPTKK